MTTGDHGLLSPGSHRAAGLVDDAALLAAMVRVEVAWLRALAALGAADEDDAKLAAEALDGWQGEPAALATAAESAGNPVPPLVAALRAAVDDERRARLVHRGLTSQDVLDTALVLLARDALARTRTDLRTCVAELAVLADRHRATVMVGRTLTQYAVPVTFGLKAAQWLSGALDALERVDEAISRLPVQCGGAAGTLSLAAERVDDPVALAIAFAGELGLVWPGLPWHTNRAPVTRIGDALVAVCDAVGVIASDVTLLSRPEIGELREGAVPGRGGSSTMPHKHNPVLAVLVRSAALQAPMLGAQLHLAAAQALDERPDGAWHSEWPAFRRLLELTVVAAALASELLRALEVDAGSMRARAALAAPELLAERGAGGVFGSGGPGDAADPAEYLGAAGRFVDAVLARVPPTEAGRG